MGPLRKLRVNGHPGGGALEVIEVEIINWDKYNPKRDQSSYSWLRLNNDFFYSSDLFDLTCEQKMVWVSLLCLASKANKGRIEVNAQFIAHHLRIKVNSVRQAIEIFVSRNLATAHDRARPLTTPTIRTNERTNETNDLAHPDGFAEFWAGYPRKVGKGQAEKAYRKAIKSGADPKDLLAARDKYRGHCESNHTESKYIKHGSTFMSEWRDWLDPETGQAEDFSQKPVSILDLELKDYGEGA
jgi:hypothetical protein